ncbi:MAG: prefoldin subunit beta [Thaumarchaeota archaeon]|nr:prefoldin subunit beta [Nitrososphaerota archaeon]
MSREEIPPMLREHVVRYEQLQQNLQAIMIQKQQVELELAEIDKALTELRKTGPDDVVYKSAGSVLVRAKRDDLLKELEEKRELDNTRLAVLAKQEQRARESAKELQTKLDEMLRGRIKPPEA